MRLPFLALLAFTTPIWADGFDRPIPLAQSATAEFWFSFSSIALVAALIVVHRLVNRR